MRLYPPEPIRLVGVVGGVEDAELSVAEDGDEDAIGLAVVLVRRLLQHSLLGK
jgi:hypothetical protein